MRAKILWLLLIKVILENVGSELTQSARIRPICPNSRRSGQGTGLLPQGQN